MTVKDIDFINGLTGEILDISECKDYTVVREENDGGGLLFWVVPQGDEYHFYAWEYATNCGERSMEDFLRNCTACGGDWVRMFFTGIKRLYPKVWEAIPDDLVFDMGMMFVLLEECGVKW